MRSRTISYRETFAGLYALRCRALVEEKSPDTFSSPRYDECMGFPWISSFCSLTVLGSWLVFTATTSAETPKSWVLGLFSQELRVLDARQQQLVAEAASLPESAAVNTGLRLGWHSQALRFSDSGAWVQVDLGGLWPVDTVALVAASGEAQGSQGGPGYGFPLRFRVELAEDEEFDMPMIVYDTGTEDVTNPGGLPIVIEAQGRRARFVRLNIFKPWPRREDWIVAIGEIIVLSGSRNVAAGQPARVSSSSRRCPDGRRRTLPMASACSVRR